MKKIEMALTTNASGGGTVQSAYPISGRVVEVRLPIAGTALTTGGSADFTLTRKNDGGTVLTLTNASAPWQYWPRTPVHSTSGGTTAYSTGVGPVYDDDGVPTDDYLVLTVAQGALSSAGTVVVFYECED